MTFHSRAPYGSRFHAMSSFPPLQTAIRATIGVTGRLLATESDLSLAERTFHMATGTLELRRGRIRPSLLFRMPLDQSMRESISATVGFGLAIVL